MLNTVRASTETENDSSFLYDVMAYICTLIGYLYAIIGADHLTLLNFTLVTLADIGWLAVYQRFTRSDNQRERWWLVALLCGLAFAILGLVPLGLRFDWLQPIVTMSVVATVYVFTFAIPISIGLYVGTIGSLILIDHGFTADVWQTAMQLLPAFLFVFAFTVISREHQQARMHAQELVVKLETTQQRLRDYADQIEELTVVRERTRIARDIHDTLGHYLTILAVKLETATKLEARGDPDLRVELVESRRIATECLAEVRQAVAALRPESAMAGTLRDTLRGLVADFESGQTDIQITLDSDESLPDLPTETRITLFRCAQEALTNIRKHADATKVLLRLRADGAQMELTVLDNGQNRTPEGEEHLPGFGLLGLRERVALLGGKASAGPDVQRGGWRVEVSVPLAAASLAYPAVRHEVLA